MKDQFLYFNILATIVIGVFSSLVNGQSYCPICTQCSLPVLLSNFDMLKVEYCPVSSYCKVTSGTDILGIPKVTMKCSPGCDESAECFSPIVTSLTGGVCPVCPSGQCSFTNAQAFIQSFQITSCNSHCQYELETQTPLLVKSASCVANCTSPFCTQPFQITALSNLLETAVKTTSKETADTTTKKTVKSTTEIDPSKTKQTTTATSTEQLTTQLPEKPANTTTSSTSSHKTTTAESKTSSTKNSSSTHKLITTETETTTKTISITIQSLEKPAAASKKTTKSKPTSTKSKTTTNKKTNATTKIMVTTTAMQITSTSPTTSTTTTRAPTLKSLFLNFYSQLLSFFQNIVIGI